MNYLIEEDAIVAEDGGFNLRIMILVHEKTVCFMQPALCIMIKHTVLLELIKHQSW